MYASALCLSVDNNLLQVDKLDIIGIDLRHQVQGIVAIAFLDQSEPLHEVELPKLELPLGDLPERQGLFEV